MANSGASLDKEKSFVFEKLAVSKSISYFVQGGWRQTTNYEFLLARTRWMLGDRALEVTWCF